MIGLPDMVLTGHGFQTGYADSSNSIGEAVRVRIVFCGVDAHVGIGSCARPGDACSK